jgi:hypothetical protein
MGTAPWRRIASVLLPILLVATVFAVYAPSLCHEFLPNWDDPFYVTSNDAIRGVSLAHLRAAFTGVYVGNYAPVQIISYMLDYSLWGLCAAGFIFTDILLHAVNGLLLYFLILRLSGERVWAFLGALVFLLHPVQVESVDWVSQRKNLLSLGFFLAALLAWLRHREGEPGRSRWWYLLSLVFFVLALLSKSVAVVLPLVLICHGLCCRRPGAKGVRLATLVPFAGVALACGLVALVTQDPGQGFGGGRTGYVGGSPVAALCTMLPVYLRYVRLIFWPSGLSAVYAPTVRTTVDPAVLAGAAVLLLLCVWGWWLGRRNPRLLFWLLVAVAGLLPVAQIIPLITLMNDRYLYFPMVGVAPLLARPAALLIAAPSPGRRTAGVLLCLLLIPLGALAVKREQAWHDGVTLWEDTLRRVPESSVARDSLVQALFSRGEALRKAGELDGALTFFRRALAIDPEDQLTLDSIGYLWLEKGDCRSAAGYFRRVANRYPRDFNGIFNLGFACACLGELDEAQAAYERALDVRPDFPRALRALGDIHARRGDRRRAALLYARAARAAANLR